MADLFASKRTQWLGITQSMFPRARLDDGERKLVLEFLLKNAKPP